MIRAEGHPEFPPEEKEDRVRLRRYLEHVRKQPCVICGDVSEAHHLTHAQARAMGRKNGDQYTVPLCHRHHMEMHHAAMSEKTWWATKGIDPLTWALRNFHRWKKQDNWRND